MINDKFIHIHIPRTGGQLIRGALQNKRKHFKFLVKNSHLTLMESLEEAKKNGCTADDLKTFCVVRNPWEWYVSRYFFRHATRLPQQEIDIELQGANVDGFQKHMYMLAEHIKEGTAIEPRKGGLPRIWHRLTLSKFHNDFTEGGRIDYIARMENYREDVGRILNEIAPRIFPKRWIDKKLSRKFNHSKHGSFKTYYNDELKNLVGEWDREYIDKFKYDF